MIFPTLSSYIPAVYFLDAMQKMDIFRNAVTGGPWTQDINRWRRLQFSFCMVNCSTVFVCWDAYIPSQSFLKLELHVRHIYFLSLLRCAPLKHITLWKVIKVRKGWWKVYKFWVEVTENSISPHYYLCITAAYKHADGKKIDGRRVLVDVERARTVKGWLPRRLGRLTFKLRGAMRLV